MFADRRPTYLQVIPPAAFSSFLSLKKRGAPLHTVDPSLPEKEKEKRKKEKVYSVERQRFLVRIKKQAVKVIFTQSYKWWRGRDLRFGAQFLCGRPIIVHLVSCWGAVCYRVVAQ